MLTSEWWIIIIVYPYKDFLSKQQLEESIEGDGVKLEVEIRVLGRSNGSSVLILCLTNITIIGYAPFDLIFPGFSLGFI